MQQYERLQKVARKLEGPSLIDQYDYYGRGNHHNCSQSQPFLEQVKNTHNKAVSGLELKDLGNHVYRVLKEPPSGIAGS